MAKEHDDRGDKAPGTQQTSSVRRRVTHHLRKLLIPGVMGLGACKSSDTPVVCDPMPMPMDAGAGAPPNTGDTDGTAGDGAAPEPTQPPPVVCDPMPAPVPRPPPPDKK